MLPHRLLLITIIIIIIVIKRAAIQEATETQANNTKIADSTIKLVGQL